MFARDPNELLNLPGMSMSPAARRWLASELASSLAARVQLRELGTHVNLIRELLLDAWDGERPVRLDDLLRSALQGFGNPRDDFEMNLRLELMLRFVVDAPEFGGEAQHGAAEAEFVARAHRARAAVSGGPRTGLTQPGATNPGITEQRIKAAAS